MRETGLVRETKWGPYSVSVQAGVLRPSGPCFIGFERKAKRNGCFSGCHWESVAPSPPEYNFRQEGTVQFQRVRCLTNSDGERFVWSIAPRSPSSNPSFDHASAFLTLRAILTVSSPSLARGLGLRCLTGNCLRRTIFIDTNARRNWRPLGLPAEAVVGKDRREQHERARSGSLENLLMSTVTSNSRWPIGIPQSVPEVL